MDEITLPRGGHTVVYRKAPRHFAVGLLNRRAQDAVELEQQVGALPARVRHVDSLAPHNLELFAVEKADTLDDVMDALRAAAETAAVTHVYTMLDSSAAQRPVDCIPGCIMAPTGTLTAQFEPGTRPDSVRAVLDPLGLAVGEVLDFLPDAYTLNLVEAAGENPLKLAARLLAAEEVRWAEPDMCFQIDRKHHPADPLYRRQWHLRNLGDGPGLRAGADAGAAAAWAVTRGKREVVVCMIDDGFDLEHPELRGRGKIVAAWDFLAHNDNPRPAGADENHGTACAGLAVAEEDGDGVVGMAPGCALMPVKTGRWLSDLLVVALFQYATYHGADVICCPWSAEAWYFPLSAKMAAVIRDAATRGRHRRQGSVILFAAGDENRPLDGEKDGRASHQGFALHPDALAIGATDSADRRASYSNYGRGLALCAPSSGLRRIVTSDRRGAAGYAAGDYTFDFGGTSAAVALAAGAAALMLSAKPELTGAAVRYMLRATADKVDPQNGAYEAGVSRWYGHGRLNAGAAVACATGDPLRAAPRSLRLEHCAQRAIAGRDGVEDTLPCGLELVIRGLSVEIEVRDAHSGLGRLTLHPPVGQPIVLPERAGDAPRFNLAARYGPDSDPGLFDALLGASARGEWRLRVEGPASQPAGVLARWSLTIAY